MKSMPYSRVLNFAWYQLLWFTAILGGDALTPFVALLLLLHLSLVARKGAELALMCGAALLGIAFDGLLAAAGFYSFAEPAGALPIPLWLVGIWMGFAGTLRSSMSFMAARPRLLTLAATVFAPVTYLGAERLGAVDFTLGAAPTAVVIGLSWWALTPMLLRVESITRSLDPQRLESINLITRPEA